MNSYRHLLKGLSAHSRKDTACLIRIAICLTDPGPARTQRQNDAGEALWCAIRTRDNSRRGSDAIAWAGREHALIHASTPVLDAAPEQEPDPRPGHYYVSCCNDTRCALLAGPWPTHQEAIDHVTEVRNKAERMDPRAWFYAFGTCRSEEALPSVFGLMPDTATINADAVGD